ncbi:MAG: DUF4968 domain-containing protein, partial [Proteobacteria bacterium]
MRDHMMHRLLPSFSRFCCAGLFVAFAGGHVAWSQPTTTARLQRSREGVVIPLQSGWLRLQVCTPRIIRVSYSPTPTFPQQKVPTVVGQFAPVPFKVASTQQSIKVATGQVQAEVNRTTGSVRFLDAKGTPILSEVPQGRSLTPTTLKGPKPVPSFIAKQDFVLDPDEGIYGLGQHQDRLGGPGKFTTLNYRGKTVSLQQDYITNLAIPFLVSSRGYGLLWDNPSPTTVGVGVGAETSIPAAQFYSESGQAGGLTGQYFNGINFDTLVATRTDPQIDFNWANAPVEGLSHDHYSVRWTGFVQAPREDDYTLTTSTDDGVRLWIDDKLVIDNWTVHALTTDETSIHFA